MNKVELKEFLDKKVDQYNTKDFIESDPISIPHLFSKKEDIEIMGFLMSTLAWGQRKTIINNGKKLIQFMDNTPFDFIINHKAKDLKPFLDFKHRTFNGDDCIFFLQSLQNLYKNENGLEGAFSIGNSNKERISNFKSEFFKIEHLKRTEKHVSNPMKGSSAKRLNMYLRWMVRKDNNGVDFGIWNTIKPSELLMPLDVHTGNVSRKLGILNRKQNDWKAVEEMTCSLVELDPNDPIKYDFALFGLGVFEGY